MFQNIFIIGQFKNCSVLQPEEKQNWNNRLSGQTNSNFFNKELVSSFFPVNLIGGQFSVTAENRHVKRLWNSQKVYTSGNIFLLIATAQ